MVLQVGGGLDGVSQDQISGERDLKRPRGPTRYVRVERWYHRSDIMMIDRPTETKARELVRLRDW